MGEGARAFDAAGLHPPNRRLPIVASAVQINENEGGVGFASVVMISLSGECEQFESRCGATQQ